MPSEDIDIIALEAELKHETLDAWLFDFGDEEPVWLPKSQCEWNEKRVFVPEWLAKQKGLI